MRKASTIKNGKTVEYPVIIEQDETGTYIAECPALRACYTQGKTFDEALHNIRDVIEMCLAEYRDQRRAIPRPAQIIGLVRVPVKA